MTIEICVPVAFLKASLKMMKNSEKKKLYEYMNKPRVNPFNSVWIKNHILYCGNTKMVMYHVLSNSQVPEPLPDNRRYFIARSTIEAALSDTHKKKQEWCTIDVHTVEITDTNYCQLFEKIVFECHTHAARDLPEISPVALTEVADYLSFFKDCHLFEMRSTDIPDMICLRNDSVRVSLNFITKL